MKQKGEAEEKVFFRIVFSTSTGSSLSLRCYVSSLRVQRINTVPVAYNINRFPEITPVFGTETTRHPLYFQSNAFQSTNIIERCARYWASG